MAKCYLHEHERDDGTVDYEVDCRFSVYLDEQEVKDLKLNWELALERLDDACDVMYTIARARLGFLYEQVTGNKLLEETTPLEEIKDE